MFNWFMATLPAIPLDEGWRFEAQADGLAATARRTFWLEPAGFCVRYFLHIEAARQVVAVVINDHDIRVVPQDNGIIVDVTDYVALEENTIALRVAKQGGTFGGIRLQAVRCEDLPE
jgi:hypothetical protein